MPRPINCRKIGRMPCVERFSPSGRQVTGSEPITLTLDEFECIRLTDLEGMYQADAAARMGVSRPTLSRISDSAHAKIARMLVNGLELRIEGGFVTTESGTESGCPRCSRADAGGRQCPRCRKARMEAESA